MSHTGSTCHENPTFVKCLAHLNLGCEFQWAWVDIRAAQDINIWGDCSVDLYRDLGLAEVDPFCKRHPAAVRCVADVWCSMGRHLLHTIGVVWLCNGPYICDKLSIWV